MNVFFLKSKQIVAICLCIASMLFLNGCQKAIKAPVDAHYLIQGDVKSTIYPVDVKQNSEDVFIQLQANAPLPTIISIDATGDKIAFNYRVENNKIITPGKFTHLQMHHQHDGVIDIIKQDISQ